MPKKHAILIANTEYRDGKLATLAHPGLAYAELAEALRDPARGAFSQVETLVNANLSHVLNTLDRFFSRKPADDILLVYVGAHGFLDSQGELFLALKESDRFRLKSTALMAAVLGMNMDQCPSPHKLLILDCRLHSPYQDGRAGQGDPRIDPAKVFAGRGLPKQILFAAGAAGVPANKVSPPAATSATQKLQTVAAKDFTRALAETLSTPSVTGSRAPFTVEDWWNAAAAELRASKAEPPQRLAVGEPPLTVLRGTSRPVAMALGSPGGESAVTMPILSPEPEGDWSRLSGIFPLELFAPDMAREKTEAGAETPEEEPPAAPTLEMEGTRGNPTLADRSFVEGADLVLRARQQIESATPADLSDPEAGTLESPLSTSPTLELPENPEPGEGLSPLSLEDSAEVADPEPAPLRADDPVRRPDAALFFDLRLPPDLSGNSTLAWDRPGNPPSSTPLGPRDTFTGLRSRLQAQEEEEKQARLKAEQEEEAQREKLEQWKSRWQSRTGLNPARAEAKGEPAPPVSAQPGQTKPRDYQAKLTSLQKTLFVPGPDAEDGTAPSDSPAEADRQATPAAPATPPLQDGRATLIVSQDQFLNTGSHKIPTELRPGATIMVNKDDFYGAGNPGNATIMVNKEDFYGAGAQGGATIMVNKEEFYGAGTLAGATAGGTTGTEGGARPARPMRTDGGSGRAGRTARPPKIPGRGPRRNKALLWALAALAPLGLGLFLFFGTKSGVFSAFGIPGDSPQPDFRAPRTVQATPRPALPPAAPAEAKPAPASEDILPPSATVRAPAVPAGSAPIASAPIASPPTPSAPVTARPVPAAPVASEPAASRRPAPMARPATPPSAAPAVAAIPAAKPADPARIARYQADSFRRAEEKALREARQAEKAALDAERRTAARFRAESLKAARFTHDSLAIFHALARKDSLRAARATRDSLQTVKALARKDSLQQARLVRDLERARRAEAETARLAVARAKADSLKAVQDEAASEALLRRSVTQALKSDAPEMRGLYNRFALGYPGLKGEVVVNLVVAPTGEIERGVIQSSNTGVKMFDQMVLGSILAWKIRPFKSREPKAILVAVNFPIE